jgi:hypothetical protein
MSLPPQFINYECWSDERRRAIDNWEQIQERLEKGPPLSWTAPRESRPDVPTREAYVEMLRRDAYDFGYTAGREAERKAVTERALRTERQEKVRQVMAEMGFTPDELRELLDSEDNTGCQCSDCAGNDECPQCGGDEVDDDGWCPDCGDHV